MGSSRSAKRRQPPPTDVQKLAILGAACAIAVVGVLNVWSTFGGPVEWTPDALFYQANVQEIRGADHSAAIAKTFQGPISAELRARDPKHTGSAEWVAYNEPFYERRVAVPLAAAALYPVDGESSLLDLSLAGYVAALLALFALLLLRFRLVVAAGVTIATAFLPALVNHSSFPLTDSWGLALEISAFAAAILTLDRGRRWLPLWIAVILRARVHSRQHVDPDPRGRVVRVGPTVEKRDLAVRHGSCGCLAGPRVLRSSSAKAAGPPSQ